MRFPSGEISSDLYCHLVGHYSATFATATWWATTVALPRFWLHDVFNILHYLVTQWGVESKTTFCKTGRGSLSEGSSLASFLKAQHGRHSHNLMFAKIVWNDGNSLAKGTVMASFCKFQVMASFRKFQTLITLCHRLYCLKWASQGR